VQPIRVTGKGASWMETAAVIANEEPRHTANPRQRNGMAVDDMPRSKTRQGKARLLTLNALDARTAAYTDALKLIDSLASDMGGDDQLSEGERQLVTRAALLGAIVADFETRWVTGQQIPLSEYLSAVNVQRRVLATLGLERRQKEVTGFGAARMIEHEEMMREEAIKRERRHGDDTTAAAVEVEHQDDPIVDALEHQEPTVALPGEAAGAPAPVAGVKYEAAVGFTGPSPASRVQALIISHRDGGEVVSDVEKGNLSLAEAAALCVRYGVTEIREDSEDERALRLAIREEQHRLLKDAEP
jgi:hypothetical protein